MMGYPELGQHDGVVDPLASKEDIERIIILHRAGARIPRTQLPTAGNAMNAAAAYYWRTGKTWPPPVAPIEGLGVHDFYLKDQRSAKERTRKRMME
jgi:hypothetical protein